MKITATLLLSTLSFCLSSAHPIENEKHLLPLPFDLPPTINKRHLRGKRGSPKKDSISSSAVSPKGDSRRSTLQTRTTLLNVDIEDLTPEQIIFFEDTWIQAFNKVLLSTDNHHQDNTSSPKLRSFVVEEILKDPNRNEDGGRALTYKLRRPRGIVSYRWFDIWALMETSCRLCGHDDDRRRILTRSMNNGDYVIQDLETTLCEGLREGPFSCFHDVEECRIVYMEG